MVSNILFMFTLYLGKISHFDKDSSNGLEHLNPPTTRWFKVTFSSPSWRSLNPLKGSLNHPKKGTLNHQLDGYVSVYPLRVWSCFIARAQMLRWPCENKPWLGVAWIFRKWEWNNNGRNPAFFFFELPPWKLTCPLKNQWLEDVFPAKIVPFLGDMLVFRGVIIGDAVYPC